METQIDADVARVARMIGHPARAAMLSALLGGEPLAAGELARRARVEPSTASEHLAQLVAVGLVTRRRAGRHVHHALASADVAAALESLACIAAARTPAAHASSKDALRFARTCYDHLAGRLGVLVTDSLLAHGVLSARGFVLTETGQSWLEEFGVDVDDLRARPRTLTRPCLDWSERRNHLAGAIGAAMVERMLEQRWLARIDGTRAVRLTVRGCDGLYRTLGLELSAGAVARQAERRGDFGVSSS